MKKISLQHCPVMCALLEKGDEAAHLVKLGNVNSVCLACQYTPCIHEPVIAPVDAVKEDVNELLSHVG